ncbi:asparaginase [Halobacillus massiliensis]|uniref:asparaginase n=1 Tax=Halobacillus massiliensis TaxID=1926286 RepID=UPI0009E4EDEB|nr:asparaginase [Halobacillus massiliensis]
MKNILIIHTGGTISMKENKETGEVNTQGRHPLEEISTLLKGETIIEDEILFYLPSPHITPDHMLKLGKHIHERLILKDYDGIVITHGTDTLEETAYFLDLYLQTKKPIIVTGAMRSSNEIGSDGLYNLLTAIKVASCDEAQSKGVLVVMNDEIHTAKNVTKTSTSNVATFQSPQYGPIGITTKKDVFFHHRTNHYDSYPIQQLSKKVALIKAYAGMDSAVIDAIRESGVNGIVLEALGQGNLPPETVPAIEKTIEKGIPIVLVSRCYQGIVQDTYSYEGGGRHLRDLGVIFANGLTGPKARIKLLILLEMTNNPMELTPMFSY